MRCSLCNRHSFQSSGSHRINDLVHPGGLPTEAMCLATWLNSYRCPATECWILCFRIFEWIVKIMFYFTYRRYEGVYLIPNALVIHQTPSFHFYQFINQNDIFCFCAFSSRLIAHSCRLISLVVFFDYLRDDLKQIIMNFFVLGIQVAELINKRWLIEDWSATFLIYCPQSAKEMIGISLQNCLILFCLASQYSR